MYRVGTYRVDQLARPGEVIHAIGTGYGFRGDPDNNIGANQPAINARRHAHTTETGTGFIDEGEGAGERGAW